MTSEQPNYEYRVVLPTGTISFISDDLADARRAIFPSDNAIIERRIVGPWEKVEL